MPPKRKSPHGSVARALLAAVKKGDVEGVSALIASDVLPDGTTMSAMQNSCLAPNAIALLDALGLHNRPPQAFHFESAVDLFSFACRRGVDPSTVVYILQSMRPWIQYTRSYPVWWEGLSSAIQRKNAMLVGCIAEVLGDILHDASDLFLTKVVESADKEFVLDVVNSPIVQALFLDMETTFEPELFHPTDPGRCGRPGPPRFPRRWVNAFKSGDMSEILMRIYQLCPLVVGESVSLFGRRHSTMTRARASWTPAKESYALFNDKIKEFLGAVQAGDVEAVTKKLEESSILVNARDSDAIPALTLSSTSPNAPALLACFRQHLHKRDRGKGNIPMTVYWHVCENGGDNATLALLMDWLSECASRSPEALWHGMKQAMTKKDLPMFTHLLQVGRNSGDMSLNTLTWLAMKSSQVHDLQDFPVDMFESEPMQEYLATLDPLEHEEEVTTWVAFGAWRKLPRLVDCMDRWSPQTTGRAMFVFCVGMRLSSPALLKFSRRHEMGIKWPNTRAAHLVQRRRLPGLDALGVLIAEFAVDVFDPIHECNALQTVRTYSYFPIGNMVTVVHNDHVRMFSSW